MKSVNIFGILCPYRFRRKNKKGKDENISWEADRAWREERGSGA